jgi:hypothetical protein
VSKLVFSLTERVREFNPVKSQHVLFLDCKKARGSALKPWSLPVETPFSGGMVHLYGSARTFFQGQPPVS